MDFSFESQPVSIPRITMKPTPSVRQPISCEPCRRRKIKCSRNARPCDTCRRRGCADNCVYLGNHDGLNSNHPASVNTDELLARISNLENLLRKQTAASQTIHDPMLDLTTDHPMLSPPTEPIHVYGLSPVSSFDSEPSFAVSPDASSERRIGMLTTSKGGDVSFEPRSSQWTAVLANTGITLTAPLFQEDADDDREEGGFPFMTEKKISTEELIAILPPIRQTEYLKDVYFTVFSPLFHILHNPTFHAQYAAFVEDPSTATPSWLAILFIIISLGVTSVEENDPVIRDLARGPNPGQNVRNLSKRYRDAAMKCLAKQGVFWGRHTVQSLQALVLLGYAMGHSQEKTWVLLGMTYNVAIALACHLDPSHFNLDPLESEQRRRCWAGVMMLYTIQNTLLGNPEPSGRLTHSVRLPVDANDIDITPTSIAPPDPMSGPTEMTYLLFKFRLYDITAAICGAVFAHAPPTRATIQSLDSQISSAQESWDLRYVADTSSSQPLPAYHAVHLHILHGYAHQLFLLLHRPFFAQSILGLEVPNESQIRCIASAEAQLDIHRLLCEIPAYRPYMWYTLGLGSFHAFHAAVVLAVALRLDSYGLQRARFRRILSETVQRMESMAERSGICARAARIVRFLVGWSTTASVSSSSSSTGGHVNGSNPSPASSACSCTSSAQHAAVHGHSHGRSQGQNQSATPASTASGSISSMTSLNLGLSMSAHAGAGLGFEETAALWTDRLQPSQWLSAGSMSWSEWDALMEQCAGPTVAGSTSSGHD